MSFNVAVTAGLMAIAAAARGAAPDLRRSHRIGPGRRTLYTLHKRVGHGYSAAHDNAGERDRRRRQIAAGSLRVANGLVPR